jgi:hypothetical protein
MEIGFSTLDRRRLEDLKDTDFERLCEELVRFEARTRHRDAKVNGPLKAGVGDGGKDLRLVVVNAPLQSRAAFAEALTEDSPTETFFSCKAGAEWRADVRKDAARKDGMTRVLARGGRLTILLNRPVDIEKLTTPPAKVPGRRAKKSFVRELAELALKAMEGMRKKLPSADDIEQRITIHDANSIVAFLRAHRPSLAAEFKAALGIVEPPGILALDRWRRLLWEDRGLPSFELDGERERLVGRLLDMLRGEGERVIWIHGPPGVGKTRLVYEALARATIQHGRVCVAPREPIGADALERHDIVEKMPDTVLVIDECPATRVHALSALFLAAMEGDPAPASRACLILIGPPGEAHASASVEVVALPPIGDLALRRIIESELGDAPPERAHTILRLSEGYPWYAVLLTREFRESGVRLPREPGAQTQFAAKLAIAPYRGEDEVWSRVVYGRARALLAVILTERRAWRSFDDASRCALCAAVGIASWGELNERVRECAERGLVRWSEGSEFRYVTPAVLAREVVSMLLSPSGGGGPELRRHAPHLADGLYDRLSELGVSPDIQRELALQTLDGWRREAIETAGLLGLASPRALLFTARLCPRETATYLHGLLVEAASGRAAPKTAAILAPALGHLLSRRGCFTLAEAALFRIVVSERGESMRAATEHWAKALVPAWGESYASVRERAAVLTRRAAADAPDDRLAALAAFERIASTERWWTTHAPHDGPWPALDRAEVRAAMLSAWRRLAELTGDPSPAVAGRARTLVCRRLRDSVRAGVAHEAVDELGRRVRAWPDADRSDLRATLDLIATYDASFVEATPGIDERLGALNTALTPLAWRDRLLDRVAHWHPLGAGSDTDRAEDLAIAHEGVEGGALLVGELDWLDAPEARRAHVFMERVGEADRAGVVLPHLIDRVREGRARNAMILPAYLYGIASGGGRPRVDALLRAWRGDALMARATVLTAWRLGADDENVGWILEDLKAKRICAGDLHPLTTGSWDREVSWDVIEPLARALLASEGPGAPQVALSFLNNRLRWEPTLAPMLAPLLIAALTMGTGPSPHSDSSFEHEWEVGMGHLADLGKNADAQEIATRALDIGPYSALYEPAWAILLRLAQLDAPSVWVHLSPRLARTPEHEARWAWHWRALGRLVPTEQLLAWMGNDPWRARVVASFAEVHTAPLSALAHTLLVRFGAASDVASTLLVSALNAPVNPQSHASFVREQLARTHAWMEDRSPEVVAWARRCHAELRVLAEDPSQADAG